MNEDEIRQFSQMHEIVQALAQTEPYVYNRGIIGGIMECMYCHDFYGFAVNQKHTKDHDAQCIWLKASTLVAELTKGQKGES